MIREVMFSWPGLDRWFIMAIPQQEYASISAGVIVVGVLVISLNVLADVVGSLANPRRHKE